MAESSVESHWHKTWDKKLMAKFQGEKKGKSRVNHQIGSDTKNYDEAPAGLSHQRRPSGSE